MGGPEQRLLPALRLADGVWTARRVKQTLWSRGCDVELLAALSLAFLFGSPRFLGPPSFRLRWTVRTRRRFGARLNGACPLSSARAKNGMTRKPASRVITRLSRCGRSTAHSRLE